MLGKKIASGFFLLLSITLVAFVQFLQSARFAQFAKDELQQHVTPVMQLDVDFSRMRVNFFPPGVSLSDVKVNPKSSNNPLGLKLGSVMHADSVGVTFPMLQAFSSGIIINKLFVSGAKGSLAFNGELASSKSAKNTDWFKKLSKPIDIQISKRFSVNIQQLELRDSSIEVALTSENEEIQISLNKINQINVKPANGIVSLLLNVDDLYLRNKNEGLVIDAIRTNLEIEANNIQVHTLDLQRGEMAANTQGKIKGRIDFIDSLDADLRVIFRARAEALEEFTPAGVGVGGLIEADLHVRGGLKDYKIGGLVKTKQPTYSMWSFDEFNVVGTLTPHNIELERAELRLNEQTLQAESFSFPLDGAPGERQLAVKFNKVNLHSFAGDLRKNINNLESVIDGKATVKLLFSEHNGRKSKLDSIQLGVDLSLQDFALNNQVYGKVRSKRDILKLKTAKLKGDFFYKDNVVELKNTVITLPTGKMDVGGFVRDGVFDLTGVSSNLNFGQDLGAISEIPFKGSGVVSVHVHGPEDALFIDFDADLSDCEFVNLQFGNLSGKAVLDDRQNILFIKNAAGTRNSSHYFVDGRVHLDDSNKIDLQMRFPDAHPNDILEIFKHQIDGIGWIPWGISGNVSGAASLGGDYAKTDNLLVRGQLHGEKIQYAGEYVHEVDAQVGFTGGTYLVQNLKARKYNSIIGGNLSYDKDRVLKYEAQVGQGKIRDLDYLAERGFPLDALLSLHSRGNGTWEKLQSVTAVDLSGAHLQTRAIPNLKFELLTAGSAWTLKSQTIPKQMSFQINVHEPTAKERSTFEFAIEPSDFGFLYCAFNRVLCSDPTANLMVATKGVFEWPGEEWQKASGQMKIDRLAVAKSGFALIPSGPIFLKSERGAWSSDIFELQGPVSKIHGSLSGDLSSHRLQASLEGESSMKLLEFLTPVISDAQGRIRLNTKVVKDGKNSNFSGNIGFSNGLLRLKGLDATAENISGNFELSGNRLEARQLNGNLGGGTFSISGGADIFLDRIPNLNFQISGQNNRLKFFPVSYAEVEDAKLSVTGDKLPYLFSGTAKMRSALMRRNFDMGQNQKSLQSSRYLPEKIAGDARFYQIKIKASAESGILVQNDLIDGEFRGEVTLLNNFEFPQLIGKAELVQGILMFRSASFTLDHAVVRLPSPEIFRPQFSVGGVTTVNNYKISMFASGTPENPQISFSSSPALPQSEILSLLAFGFKGEDTKGVSRNDMSAITYSEVGSILLEQLRINRDLQSKGFKVTVVPTINDNEANIARPRSAADTAYPKIVLQSQIAKNLDAVLGATLGATQNQELSGSLEYQLGRRTSVSGVFEQQQGADAVLQSSYGADLKFRWGIK